MRLIEPDGPGSVLEGGYLLLDEAAKLVPNGNKNKLWRWCRFGVGTPRGRIFLRFIRPGQVCMTRREWLESFFERLAEAQSEPAPVKSKTVPNEYAIGYEQAVKKLEAMGS